ncbi:MAG: hypothetical protein J6C52_05405, partial [Clostridia bacterium]|nr:hypothetical protein [Clostridia bacterium]
MKSIKSMIILLLLLAASCASTRELKIVPAEYDYSLDNPAVAHEIVRMIFGRMPLEPDPETVTIDGPYLFWQLDEASGQIVQEHEYLRSTYYHINYSGEIYPVSLHRRVDGS